MKKNQGAAVIQGKLHLTRFLTGVNQLKEINRTDFRELTAHAGTDGAGTEGICLGTLHKHPVEKYLEDRILI